MPHEIVGGAVHGLRPRQALAQRGVARRRYAGFERGVAKACFGGHPAAQRIGNRDIHFPGPHFGTPRQAIERFHQSRKAIHAAALGIEVHELPALAGEPAHRLQVVVIHEAGNEALLVLHFHGVERAAIGIDGHQELVLRGERKHGTYLHVNRGVPLNKVTERSGEGKAAPTSPSQINGVFFTYSSKVVRNVVDTFHHF